MELLDKAILFATQAHKGQIRKVGGLPYILHPLEVCTIASTITGDETVLAAALLHDTVEDTGVDINKIRREFGERVALLVSEETENKREGTDKYETWKIRKQETMEKLAVTGRETKIIALADKLSNMRSIYAIYCEIGDEVFNGFNMKDKNMHGWYYKTIAKLIEEDLKDTIAYKEYVTLVEKIFGEIDDEQ